MSNNNAFTTLLGPKLLAKSGFSKVDSSSLSSKAVVGLYFSAHWCPPCRSFTPHLARKYNDMKSEGKKIEIVFVSSDKDKGSFDDYYGEMPWLALPFSERKLKEKLSKKFKVQGIPTLVLLDGQGNLLTKDGRTAIASPEDYPWATKSLNDMLGTSFLSGEQEVGKEAIEGKYLGLYFSASWCPPCRQFTPVLAEYYENLKKERQDFEFIFVSGDSSESAFLSYFKKMPFLALPYKEQRNIQLLNSYFEVEGIPTFVIISPNGNTITTDARSGVMSDPEGKEFPYYPKPVKNIDSPDGINDTQSLVILAEGETKPTQEKYEQLLSKLGEEDKEKGESKGEDPEFLYFIGTKEGGVAERLRGMGKLGDSVVNGGEETKEVVCEGDECRVVKKGGKKANTKVIMFDIPDDGGFYVWGGEGEVTEEVLRGFIKEFKEGKLERQQLGR